MAREAGDFVRAQTARAMALIPEPPRRNGDQDPPNTPPEAGIDPPKKPIPQEACLQHLRVEIQAQQRLFASIRAGAIPLDGGNREWLSRRVKNVDLLMEQLKVATESAAKPSDSVIPSYAALFLWSIWEQIKLCPLYAVPDNSDIARQIASPPGHDRGSPAASATSRAAPPAAENGSQAARGEHDPDQTRAQWLDWVDRQFRMMVFEIGYFSVPSTLDGWLVGVQPGYYVPFHSVFEDELPLQEDRSKLLNFLTHSPDMINHGIVDSGRGLIYRYDHRPWHQWASVVLVVVAFLVCTWIVAYAAHPADGAQLLPRIDVPLIGKPWGPLNMPGTNFFDSTDPETNQAIPAGSWPLSYGGVSNASLLIIGWLALLAGVIVHIAVSTAKAMQTQGGSPPIMAASQLAPRVNAFFGAILLKLFMALFAFFALAFSSDLANTSYLSFFLAGYALDSVVDLFGTTLEKRSTAQVTSLQGQFGATTGAGAK